MSLTVSAAVVHYFATGGTFSGITAAHWVRVGALVVGGALMGKLAGIFYARYRMLRLIDEIASESTM